MKYAIPNPIIQGFAPDPSVCLIGDTFFLVNSSFHVFPGLPIYMSKDLMSWTHIGESPLCSGYIPSHVSFSIFPGNAIHRTSQLSLDRATTILHSGEDGDDGNTIIATGGLYAPTIRHHKGTTYIVCTNVIHGTSVTPGREANFVIHTTDIYLGNWSDPVYYDFPGIDPSILFDDDDKVFVQGTKVGATQEFQIYNMEVDLRSGEILTEPKLIWAGWDKRFTEGPHIYKKDGLYYLLCAEGGTFTTHMISMARSDSIWGPYETCPRNPIWTAHGTSKYVQHTGHAELFQDAQSRWWAVTLGVRMNNRRFNMGRETFLTRVEWPERQWPTLHPVVADPKEAKKGFHRVSYTDSVLEWLYLRDPRLDRYKVQGRDIYLCASTVGLTSPDKSPTFIGKRQRMLTGSANVTLCTDGLKGQCIRAGLVMYKDELRFLEVGYDFEKQEVFYNGINKPREFVRGAKETKEVEDLNFEIRYTETSYEISYQPTSGKSWTLLGEVDTLETSGFDFTGPLLGMFAVGPDVVVRFRDFGVDHITWI